MIKGIVSIVRGALGRITPQTKREQLTPENGFAVRKDIVIGSDGKVYRVSTATLSFDVDSTIVDFLGRGQNVFDNAFQYSGKEIKSFYKEQRLTKIIQDMDTLLQIKSPDLICGILRQIVKGDYHQKPLEYHQEVVRGLMAA